MERAAKDVLPVLVGAKDMDLAAFDPEKMRVHLDQAKELVAVAIDEEFYIEPLILVDLGHPAEIRSHRPFAFDPMDKGPRRTAVGVAEHRDLRRTVGIVLVAPGDGRIIGREKGRKEA